MTITTPRGFKLGRNPSPPLPGVGYLSTYATPALPTPPPEAHYGGLVKVPWEMCGNGPDPSVTVMGPNFQGVGDCVPACAAHDLIMSNADEPSGAAPVPTGNDVVEAYCAYLGCTPAEMEANPNLDTGCDIASFLGYWQKTGVYGTKIDAYAPVQPSNRTEVEQGLAFFGGLVLGLSLPASAEAAFPNEWVYVPGSEILGGHCVLATGYDSERVYLCTWGALVIGGMTWQFFNEYVDEAFAVITSEAVASGWGPVPGYGAGDLDLAQLKADLAAV